MRTTICIIDIDNTLADVNSELQEKGYRTDIYPSPIPNGIFDNGEIFANAKPMQQVIELAERMSSEATHTICMTSRPYNDAVYAATEEWLRKNTNLTSRVHYTQGLSKAELLVRMYSPIVFEAMSFCVFEDSPHEIAAYENLGANMRYYIPEWDYNSHIRADLKSEVMVQCHRR